MHLTTRLTVAMVSLVLLTAAAVGYLSYRNLETTVLPAELTRLESRAHLHVASLEGYVREARADVLMLSNAPALDGVRRARAAGGIDPVRNMPERDWREMLARLMVAEVKTKPAYDQFRLIGMADGGRELIRVDHSGPNGAVHIVPDAELQQKGDRSYFNDAIRLAAGQVYISHIELNQEHGVVQIPHTPSIRAATPVFDLDGKVFGILIINVDMRPAFAELRQTARANGAVYVVDARGNYLLHPDRSREFGFDLGHEYRVQTDFPALAPALTSGEVTARKITDNAGQDFIAGMVPAHLAGGPQVSVIETLPLDVALASATSIRQSSLLAGLIAALCAALIAVFTARSLARPLTSLTQALEHFTGEEHVEVPQNAKGEIGVLASAFERMAKAVREKTNALQSEIEERIRAEAEVGRYAEREKIYAAAIESTNDAVVTCTLDGTITTWNPAAERIFGYAAKEAIGQKTAIIAAPEKRAEQRENLEKIRRGERIENFETVRVAKNGTPVDVAITVSLLRSPSGEIVGASEIKRDITEQKRNARALQQYAERERLYLAAVESANDAIFTVDLAGTITTWNPAAERLFGFSAAEAIGKNVSVIATADQLEQQKSNFARIKRGERLENFETMRTRKDGSTIHLSYNSSPILSTAGEIVGASAIARDITERKNHERILAERALELQRSNAELEQFAYVASHDLQEPLRMVASYAELLAERYQGKLDDKADKYIHYAVDGAKRMQRLVNDLLAYSRVGTQGRAPQPTDVNTVAGHVLHTLKQKIDDSGAQVEIASLPVVNADDGQLGQLLQNLIGNALKFRGQQPLRVRVGARSSGEGWVFFVEDNGIGIEPQYAERVFQMFQRLHDREAYEGSGIGLTIAKKIVERHGGRIWFESEPGKGTTFFFTLPATQEKAA